MKIYISGTYRDLQSHRLAVSNVLRRMGHQVIGMEDYVAEDGRPLSRCLADVESCDAYIGIFAWRYGSVPKTPDVTTLPANTTLGKTSITEFEFRHAIAKGKPVLLFVLDQDAEWPPNYFDAITGEGEQGKAITQLRQELTGKHLISYFRTPDDLASHVSASVYRTEMNRQLDLKSVNIEQGLNQSWIRHDDPVNDSRLGTIQDVIAGPTELQALQVDIGLGREWWVTRLYFLSSITAELTPIEVIIFLGETGKFIGVAHPRIVQERLLQSHPVLKNYETALQAQPRSPSADLRGEVQRRADCWQKALAQEEQTSPIWVTKRELSRWLAPYMITRAVDWEPGSVAALQMQRLLDWPMRFVPVVEKDRFVRVVDKQALTDQIARIFVREQVLRALSTTR